jgi:phosphocarrier protein
MDNQQLTINNMKLTRKVIIPNELGLHAHAAAKIARLAEGARSEVYIVKDGQEVDATSILDVMALYCPCGTEVVVKITGPGDVKVLNRIVRLIETGFGEL